ncbi:hypothetical protein VFPPC_16960 [Pochonia chlamydosporia 170]|uniref:Uncharacterized protein n=1 Tax=Pochonia chlamydosporia 170 TaxID=1380566 RepID=A0A179F012_METCM|nr:hypothetical protein VFPPC_16960 [Pochonia chlamydosporia 170]OAQ58600.1 hypothetical protein VFPPC_16960 [Pochonia chlamydosporia 170]
MIRSSAHQQASITHLAAVASGKLASTEYGTVDRKPLFQFFPFSRVQFPVPGSLVGEDAELQYSEELVWSCSRVETVGARTHAGPRIECSYIAALTIKFRTTSCPDLHTHCCQSFVMWLERR